MLAAFFAVSLFVISSAFVAKKTADTEYGNLKMNRIHVSGDIYKYVVEDLAENEGACTEQPGEFCKVVIDPSNAAVVSNTLSGSVRTFEIDESIGSSPYQPQLAQSGFEFIP
jgi:hypothetical protein